jgi:hypothetical protein
LTAIVFKQIAKYYLKGKFEDYSINLVVLVFSFVGPLYLPWIKAQYYLGTGSPNVWHNPTNNAVKPFAIAIAFLFIVVYQMDCSQKKQILKIDFNKQIIYYCLFSILILISVFMKPSFIQIFFPAVTIFLLIEAIGSRGEKFKQCLKAALTLLPSILFFAYQYVKLFHSEGTTRVIISPFEVWHLWTPSIILSLILTLAFPLFVIIQNWSKINHDKFFALCILSLLFGIMEFILFAEDGSQKLAGNFSWGYLLGCSLVWAVSIIYFFKYYAENKTENSKLKKFSISFGFGLLSTHFLLGASYYCYILTTPNIQC